MADIRIACTPKVLRLIYKYQEDVFLLWLYNCLLEFLVNHAS